VPHPAVAGTRPLVFAHRGGALLAPENTLAAFDRGLAHGADGLELDVHLSRDGIVVVHHDVILDRTTDASGPVETLSAGELARVDAGARYGDAHGFPFRQQGIGVPTLREVLERYTDARIIVELKRSTRALACAVVDEIHRAGAERRVCVGGFGWRGLREVRRLDPNLATGAAHEEVRWALYRSWVRLPWFRPAYCAFQVPERAGSTTVVTPAFVRAANRAGVAVHVWTVDDPEDIVRLLNWGVTGIITDRPDVAVPVVHDWFARH